MPDPNYFADDPNQRNGVRVAAKDVNNDGRTDIIAGTESKVVTALANLTSGIGTPPLTSIDLSADFPFGGVNVG